MGVAVVESDLCLRQSARAGCVGGATPSSLPSPLPPLSRVCVVATGHAHGRVMCVYDRRAGECVFAVMLNIHGERKGICA